VKMALPDPIWLQGVKSQKEFAVALVAYLLLAVWKMSAWKVVALAATAGFLLLG